MNPMFADLPDGTDYFVAVTFLTEPTPVQPATAAVAVYHRASPTAIGVPHLAASPDAAIDVAATQMVEHFAALHHDTSGPIVEPDVAYGIAAHRNAPRDVVAS